MNQTINIADLVTPKFKPGQDVWVVRREYNGQISGLWPMRIEAVEFAVEITIDKHGAEHRKTTMVYRPRGNAQVTEDQIFASLDDIPEEYRKPRLG